MKLNVWHHNLWILIILIRTEIINDLDVVFSDGLLLTYCLAVAFKVRGVSEYWLFHHAISCLRLERCLLLSTVFMYRKTLWLLFCAHRASWFFVGVFVSCEHSFIELTWSWVLYRFSIKLAHLLLGWTILLILNLILLLVRCEIFDYLYPLYFCAVMWWSAKAELVFILKLFWHLIFFFQNWFVHCFELVIIMQINAILIFIYLCRRFYLLVFFHA